MIDAPRSLLADGFVRRLRHVVKLRTLWEPECNAKGIALLDDMIVRSFRDCLEVGAQEEARVLTATIRNPKRRVR